MTPRKFYLLASPVYVSAVFLLLLNDFLLKKCCPGWFSGKLSDFAGLFAFSVFALILVPRRLTAVCLGLAFAFWKTPFSQVLISFWNSAALWPIQRTVDYADLLALSILPVAWIFHQQATRARIQRGWWLASASISLFAFCATSKAPTPEQMAAFHAAVAEYNFTESQPTYALPFSRKELYQRIEALGFAVMGGTGIYPDFNKHSAYILPRPAPQWSKPRQGRTELFEAVFDVDNAPMGVRIHITKIQVKRGSGSSDKSAAVEMFEARVIAPLRAQLKSN